MAFSISVTSRPRPVEHDGAAVVALEHEDGIGCAGEAERSADGIEGVVGVGFAQVVDEHDGDAVFIGQVAETFHGCVVRIVGRLISPVRRAHHCQGVDDDEARLFGRPDPILDLVEATLGEAWHFGEKVETCGPAPRSEEFVQAAL